MNPGLPNNIEAEKSLLGSIFWSSYALQRACEELSSEVFFLDSHAKIFECIAELYNKHQPVDISTVVSLMVEKNIVNLTGGVEYLNELVDSVATGANIDYYIDKVLEKYTLRKMIEVATSIVSMANDPSSNLEDAVEYAEKSILNVSKTRRGTEFRTVTEVLNSARENIDNIVKNKGKLTGLTSGLTDLDRITTGFQPTQLIILAARPAVGKTAFALNVATAAAKSTKKNIAIFSLEMPAEQLIMRMISSLGQIDAMKLQKGNLETDDYRKINEAISQLADTNIYFHDGSAITASEIQAKCRRLATQGEGLGLVIIDYLQLISSSSKYSGSRQQEVSEISRKLKTMALELEVPVIALSQLSRDVEKREDKKVEVLFLNNISIVPV